MTAPDRKVQPVLKFSRDKRGYEHVYLVQATNHRGKTRSRVLYWFRTPPGITVGREPFDEAVRRALEAQNPDVAFDWPKLIGTPIPPPAPDVERWRERRRAERAAREPAEVPISDADVDESPAPDDEREQSEAEVMPLESAVAGGGEPVEVTSSAPARRRRRRRRRRSAGSGQRHETSTTSGTPGPNDLDTKQSATPRDGHEDETSDV